MPVYDLSYRRGRGPIRRGPRWWPIYVDCLRYSFRNKWMKIILLWCWSPALATIALLYVFRNVMDRVVGRIPGFFLEFDLGRYDVFYAWNWMPVVLLATGAGAGLIAEDRRSHALEIYFSRAIYRSDYLIGKILGMSTVLLFGSAVPFVVAWFFDCGMSTDVDRFAATWDYPLRFLANGVLFAVPTSLIVLAISSFSRRSLSASIYWIALAFFSRLLGLFAAEALLKDFRGGLLSYIDTFNALRYWVFDIPTAGWAQMHTPPVRLAAMLIAILALSSIVVLVRRTQPTEVVS